MFEARERAYRLYRRRGERRSAGRLATLLGIDYHQFRGEAAIGNGWFRRAHRLLEGLPPVPEHGWLWIWVGQIALLVGNDLAAARRLGAEAGELGSLLDLVDLEVTGLGLEGLALVTLGETSAGMTRLDEATAAAVGGEMSVPNAIGATCCYLIYACERVREPTCDGVGGLWFETDEQLETALTSSEMAAAVEDAKSFLNMDKTGLIIVEELSILE